MCKHFEIPLTNGMVATVDMEFSYLKIYRWYGVKSKNTYYALGLINGKKVSLHRIIMNAKKGEIIDHKDKNGLNNTKDNLRICTQAQNYCNRSVSRSKRNSKYLGVGIPKSNPNKFVARITKNKKCFHIGTFDTENEAALAYNQKAIEIHGEFASLNVITAPA